MISENFLVEHCNNISIDNLIRMANQQIKKQFIQNQLIVLGISVQLTTSKTRFNGKRIWIVCPNCERRVGIIYQQPISKVLGCRVCLKLTYWKQRYKDMIEQNT